MNTPLAAMLGGWHEFYVLVGESAATLIGLMFVAVTFGATRISVEATTSTRSFLDPTITHFVQVLVTACLAVVPSVEPSVFGGALVVIGIGRMLSLVKVHRTMREAHAKYGDIELSDWMSGIVVPCGIYVGLLVSGSAFLTGRTAFAVLAVTTVLALLNGIVNAWELVIWLAFERARAAQQKE